MQLATDITEIYPGKKVTLIHSRPTVMNRFHDDLDVIIKERCAELGVNLKLGSRVKLPAEGFPEDGPTFNVELQDGSSVAADFAVGPMTMAGELEQHADTITTRSFAQVKHHNHRYSRLCLQSQSTSKASFACGRRCKSPIQSCPMFLRLVM